MELNIEEYKLLELVEREPEILNKINMLVSDCFNKPNTLMQKLDNREQWSIITGINNDEVLCMIFLFHTENNIIQFYNVCTSKNHRKKGYIAKLFHYISYKYDNYVFQLNTSNITIGDITETDRIEVYTKIGFYILEGTRLILLNNDVVDVIYPLFFPSSRTIQYYIRYADQSTNIIKVNQIKTCEKVQPYGDHTHGCLMVSNSDILILFKE
jgi:hypothetical protein